MKDGAGMKVPAPFLKMTLKNGEEMQAAGADYKSGRNDNNTQKYWKCMRHSVIMSLSCIVQSIVNYNYSEDSLIKRDRAG